MIPPRPLAGPYAQAREAERPHWILLLAFWGFEIEESFNESILCTFTCCRLALRHSNTWHWPVGYAGWLLDSCETAP